MLAGRGIISSIYGQKGGKGVIHGCNSSGSTIREKEVRLGGFCDQEKKGRGNEKTTTSIKFQEQMRKINPCSTA